MALIRSNRDLRVDFFRGVALWWIFTDHIPGDRMAAYSLQNFALCDAAEVFVLLAGYGAGLAYGRAMDRHGYLFGAADVLRRAWTLYIAHIFLFVVFAAQVSYSAATLNRAFYLDESRLDVLAEAPYEALMQALLLRYQPSLLNILPLYVVLLLMLALALPLLRRPVLLLAGSFALYCVSHLGGLNLPSWTEGAGWYFNPLAWQLLFMIGAVMAYHPLPMPRVRWPFDALAVLTLASGLMVIWGIDAHPRLMAALPAWAVRLAVIEDKTGLHPFRLASILSLTWLVIRLVPFDAAWLRSRLAAPLVLIGQQSLPVFCSGVLFGFLGRIGFDADEGWAMQILVNGLGATAMVAVGALAAWYRARGRETSRPPAALPALAQPDTG